MENGADSRSSICGRTNTARETTSFDVTRPLTKVSRTVRSTKPGTPGCRRKDVPGVMVLVYAVCTRKGTTCSCRISVTSIRSYRTHIPD